MYQLPCHPRDLVTLREPAPYRVPQGRIFVLLSLGQEYQTFAVPPFPHDIGPLTDLFINGEKYLGGANIGAFNLDVIPGAFQWYEMMPAYSRTPKLAFVAGTLIEVKYVNTAYPLGVSNFGRGTGYLVND